MNNLVLLETSDRIAFLTLNHPEKRNALSRPLLTELRERLASLASGVERVVVLRANGPAFCAGHDLRELVNTSRADATELFALCTEVMLAIRHLPQPVIAQVHGIATAAGCQLAATCDLVVASDDARFATPGVKIGLFCTTPGVAVVRAVLPKKAMEMLLTGEPISAQEAERIGLVNRVVAKERLAEETLALARHIAKARPAVLALGKRAFYEQTPMTCEQAYQAAQPVMVENALLADAKEGMMAFLEKREAKW